jgi:hypothetical protein
MTTDLLMKSASYCVSCEPNRPKVAPTTAATKQVAALKPTVCGTPGNSG